ATALGQAGQGGSFVGRISAVEQQVADIIQRLDELDHAMKADPQCCHDSDHEMHWIMDYIGVPPLGKQAEYLWNGRDMNLVPCVREPRPDYPGWEKYRSQFQTRISENAVHSARRLELFNEWPEPPAGTRARTEIRDIVPPSPKVPRAQSVPLAL